MSVEQSAQICANSLSSLLQSGLFYGNILPVTSPRAEVNTVTTNMYTVYGKPFQFGPQEIRASQEDYEFGKRFFGLTEELLEKGLLKPHVHRVGRDGLEGVLQGLKDLESGKVKGEKLVYLLNDTP